MSSEYLDPSKPRAAYLWNAQLDPADYLVATYRVETSVDPELAAIAMAKEQSAGTLVFPGSDAVDNIEAWTARVTAVEKLGETATVMLPGYRLNTPVYDTGGGGGEDCQVCQVSIAFPIRMFGRSMTGLWNAVGGELHRLGFVNALRLLDLRFPDDYLAGFHGPRHGAVGLRQRLGVWERPIFCRSARPAVGLSTEAMLRINEQVLRGGFDVVKDDELTPDASPSPFAERVKAMARMVRRAEDATGARKMYFANVIAEIRQTLDYARTAVRAGVDGLLVSPMLQGLEIARTVAEETGLPVLAHNTWEDVCLRHPRFGVAHSLYIAIQRIIGVDLIMLPGAFASGSMQASDERTCVAECAEPRGTIRPVLPIMAGGKTPASLVDCLRAAGSPDFMLIAAAAVDQHPAGVFAGAQAFRQAWDALQTDASLAANNASLEKGRTHGRRSKSR